MLIIDLYGISFHAVVVFFFKSIQGHCIVTLFLFAPMNLTELKIKRISLVRCNVNFEKNFRRIQFFFGSVHYSPFHLGCYFETKL